MRWLLLAGSALILVQGTSLILKSAKSEFRVENASSITAEHLGAGKFSATGAPVRLLWRDAGLTATAGSVEGESGLVENTDQYYVKSALLAGGASITIDSDAAYAFEVEKAVAAGTQPPAAEIAKRSLTFSGDSLSYSGDLTVGTVTVPGPFNAIMFQHGIESVKEKNKTGSRIYDDNMEAHGTSATIEIFLQKRPDNNPIRKGTVMGPITFKFTRNSSLDGAPEPERVVNGVADRMDIDFLSAEHTVTLTGNVKMNGVYETATGKAGQKFDASVEAAVAVLTFGPHNELLRIQMKGSPTTTDLKLRPQGGGRGR